MELKDAVGLESKYYAHTFKRLPVAVERGEGMYLYGTDGTRYLDMFAGIAVNSLGHAHPKVVEAIREQAGKLIHASNWFYTIPQLELAKLLTEITGLERTFLTNDGTEAVEAAIKLARKVSGKKGIVAMENAFHGRTMGSLSITYGEKYRKPFEPLVPGMKFVTYGDAAALGKAMDDDTAAVIIEPVQGEAGVIIPDAGYLKEVRELTESRGVLLIVDEVQTGFGRTGSMFAFQESGIRPDILCLAKGMGSGFPIGAIVYGCGDFTPGEHGGTFIGNPLACAAAKAVIETIVKEDLCKNAEKTGSYLLESLRGMGFDARGKGLMIGIDVPDGEKAVLELIEKKVLTIYSKNTVRALPPLIIEKTHADAFLSAAESLKR